MFVHLFISGQLGCFYLLALANNAAVKMGVYVSAIFGKAVCIASRLLSFFNLKYCCKQRGRCLSFRFFFFIKTFSVQIKFKAYICDCYLISACFLSCIEQEVFHGECVIFRILQQYNLVQSACNF